MSPEWRHYAGVGGDAGGRGEGGGRCRAVCSGDWSTFDLCPRLLAADGLSIEFCLARSAGAAVRYRSAGGSLRSVTGPAGGVGSERGSANQLPGGGIVGQLPGWGLVGGR